MKSAQLLLTENPARAWAIDGSITIVASLFIALCSQVSVPFPFTPVPFTLQANAVLVTAYVLGPQRGFLAVCAFLMEGLMGLPVFANGASGLAVLLGPTGGYLLSYLGVSYLVGSLAERKCQGGRGYALGIFALAYLLIYACGALVLAAYVGWTGAWMMGIYPFLLIDALKISMLVITLPIWRKGVLWLN